MVDAAFQSVEKRIHQLEFKQVVQERLRQTVIRLEHLFDQHGQSIDKMTSQLNDCRNILLEIGKQMLEIQSHGETMKTKIESILESSSSSSSSMSPLSSSTIDNQLYRIGSTADLVSQRLNRLQSDFSKLSTTNAIRTKYHTILNRFLDTSIDIFDLCGMEPIGVYYTTSHVTRLLSLAKEDLKMSQLDIDRLYVFTRITSPQTSDIKQDWSCQVRWKGTLLKESLVTRGGKSEAREEFARLVCINHDFLH